MHLEALLGLETLMGFAAAESFIETLVFTEGFFAGDESAAALRVQLLFVQRPSMTSEPHSQNSAKNKSLLYRIILYHHYDKIMLQL